jgi:hypothetical protein
LGFPEFGGRALVTPSGRQKDDFVLEIRLMAERAIEEARGEGLSRSGIAAIHYECRADKPFEGKRVNGGCAREFVERGIHMAAGVAGERELFHPPAGGAGGAELFGDHGRVGGAPRTVVENGLGKIDQF